MRALLQVFALVAALAVTPVATAAQRHHDPELRGVIAAALAVGECFEDKYERAVWFAYMEPRLARYVESTRERGQILENVHCEARRLQLPPELLLAVMDVESRFLNFSSFCAIVRQ